MDPKKRTTIIVLLILTILLGIASVFIATQVQRNNAVANSYAGDLTVPAPTSTELYDAVACSKLVENLDVTTTSVGTLATNNLTCRYSDEDQNNYTLTVIKNNYTSVEELKVSIEEDVRILQTFSQELVRGVVYSMYGVLDEECIGYAVSENYKDSYITVTFESETACDTEDNTTKFGGFMDDMSYKIYSYFTE